MAEVGLAKSTDARPQSANYGTTAPRPNVGRTLKPSLGRTAPAASCDPFPGCDDTPAGVQISYRSRGWLMAPTGPSDPTRTLSAVESTAATQRLRDETELALMSNCEDTHLVARDDESVHGYVAGRP